jgi:hypothetical protein
MISSEVVWMIRKITYTRASCDSRDQGSGIGGSPGGGGHALPEFKA